MAKELTHILIARDVIKKLKEFGQPLLAQVIEKNLSAYYLGSIIPDTLFYDFPPFRLNPRKYLSISRALHQEEKTKNDRKAMGFFRSISANPHMWPLKMAFSAGIITHTVVDRIFHNLIEYYITTWGERGRNALATHREFETLIDIALLESRNIHPRQFRLGSFVRLDHSIKYYLFQFYLADLMGEGMAPSRSLLNVLKRASHQQCFFLQLFAARPIYRIMEISNRLASDRLRAWQSLFYPDGVGPQTFSVLAKLEANPPHNEILFNGGLARHREAALNEAIRHINLAVTTFA
jgi:hypothetical protein